jgi:hypothetical protein
VNTVMTDREALLDIARREIAEEFKDMPDPELADLIKARAPALKDASVGEVLYRLEDLASEVAKLDGLAAGDLTWCQVLPEATGSDRDDQAWTAVKDRLGCTLAELLGEVA